ncbi:mucin-2 [Trichomycterus rosablanca]|uniref:mucin-2 n=1 Tax=Trichomycterus rosablanca TaxID=2290929 RepID=UPI002F352675
MYVFVYTLLFWLAFGPQIKLLHAQETETSAEPEKTTGTSVTHPSLTDRTSLSLDSASVSVPENSTLIDHPTLSSKLDDDPESNGTQSPTSGGISDPEIPTTKNPESPTTDNSDIEGISDQAIYTTEYTTTINADDKYNSSTIAASSYQTPAMQPDAETTTTVQESPSTLGLITTARPDTTRSEDAEPTTMHQEPTAASTGLTTQPVPEEEETTTGSDAGTPSPSQTPAYTTSIATTSEAISTSPNHSTTNPDVISSPGLLIIIIAVIISCILLFCVIGIALNCKRKSGRQNFGHKNDRTKKKKGAETDVWAGPVKLEGGDKADCDELDEGLGQEEDQNDGTKVMLSTFVAPEENGGVGRPGSKEVQKWEEKEPLLYIDEGAKAEGKEKDNDGNASGPEKTDEKKPVQNGGEAFCLTSAV